MDFFTSNGKLKILEIGVIVKFIVYQSFIPLYSMIDAESSRYGLRLPVSSGLTPGVSSFIIDDVLGPGSNEFDWDSGIVEIIVEFYSN